jgi:hypothetical protein
MRLSLEWGSGDHLVSPQNTKLTLPRFMVGASKCYPRYLSIG